MIGLTNSNTGKASGNRCGDSRRRKAKGKCEWTFSLVPGISYLLQNQMVGDSGRMHPEYDWLPGRAGRVLLAGSGKVACYRMKREKLIGLNQ